ncbi:hypothetical protein [Peribacillus asahii]
MIDHQTIVDSIYRTMKNVNQLKRLMDEKVEVFSKRYSQAEMDSIFKQHKPLNEKNATQYVNDLYSLARKCFQTNEEKEQITEGFLPNKEKEQITEGFLSSRKEKKITEGFLSNREKEKINYEFNQFFLTHEKQRKRTNEFQSFRNDTNNVWVAKDVCCQIPFKPCCNKVNPNN